MTDEQPRERRKAPFGVTKDHVEFLSVFKSIIDNHLDYQRLEARMNDLETRQKLSDEKLDLAVLKLSEIQGESKEIKEFIADASRYIQGLSKFKSRLVNVCIIYATASIIHAFLSDDAGLAKQLIQLAIKSTLAP